MFPYIHIPTLHVGPLSFQAFGLLVASGVILGSTLTRRRTEQLGLDLNVMIDSIFWILPGGFILSHVFDVVLYFPERILKNPLTLLYFWEGISSFGGFLGGLLIGILYFRYRKVPMLPYLDALAYGFVPGFTLGRIGCSVAHDHPGLWLPQTLTSPSLLGVANESDPVRRVMLSLPPLTSPSTWIALLVIALVIALLVSMIREKPLQSGPSLLAGAGFLGFAVALYASIPAALRLFTVHWPTPWSQFSKAQLNKAMILWNDGPFTTRLRYDLGLIEAIYYITVCAVFIYFVRRKSRPHGFLLAFWFLSYAPIRFLLDFLRTDDTRYGILTPGQYFSIVTLIIGIWIFRRLPTTSRWGAIVPGHPPLSYNLPLDALDASDPSFSKNKKPGSSPSASLASPAAAPSKKAEPSPPTGTSKPAAPDAPPPSAPQARERLTQALAPAPPPPKPSPKPPKNKKKKGKR